MAKEGSNILDWRLLRRIKQIPSQDLSGMIIAFLDLIVAAGVWITFAQIQRCRKGLADWSVQR